MSEQSGPVTKQAAVNKSHHSSDVRQRNYLTIVWKIVRQLMSIHRKN